MPLNCLPATTSVAAMELKRGAARAEPRGLGDCGAGWSATIRSTSRIWRRRVRADFKCFLIDAGIAGFTMVSEAQLRAALPHVVRTGLPLLVHAELAGPVEDATAWLGR